MKYFPGTKIIFIVGVILVAGIRLINAQTTVKSGDTFGSWTKKGSPYLIKGDINIPTGKTLIIQPGVRVKFEGLNTLNVQGSLIASGTVKDSIVFTMADTSGIMNKHKYGWNGIRFDRRPVYWDTLKFKMPEKDEFKKIMEERIKSGRIDTTTKIRLALKIPDIVNDTALKDDIFITKQGSQLSYCRFEYATSVSKKQPYVFGGAIYIYRYSSLVISNSVFENNFAYAGGAIYCKEAAPVITNNRITKCRAQSSGGAMVFIHSGPILLNNMLNDNFSGYNGGAALFYESTPYVLNNTLLRNQAENSGGAVFCEQEYDSLLWSGIYSPAEKIKFKRDATFEKTNLNSISLKNTTSYNGRFINNVICDNKASMGGGIGLFGAAPEFTNITLSNNTADTAGGGIYCFLSAPQVTNSIVYGNAKDQVFLIGESHPVFSYCNIESGISGITKDSTCRNTYEYSDIINVSPRYASPAGGDYTLSEGSACIDAGMPDTASLKLSTVDLSGKNRIVNNRIDLGAIEYTGNKPKLKSTEGKDEGTENLFDDTEEMFTSIFPNPTIGWFSIVIHNNKYESISVKIVSLNGQTVYKNNFKTDKWFEQQIDLSAYARGIYSVLINSDDTLIYNGEIIIE